MVRRSSVESILGALVAVACGACGDNLSPAVTMPDARDPADAAGDAPRAHPLDRLFGGAAADDLLDVAVIDDEVIVAGYRDGIVGVTNIEPSGNSIGVIQGYARDGALRWQRTFETSGADTIEALHVGATDIAFVGRTDGAFAGFTNAGQTDAFVGLTSRDANGSASVFQLGDNRPQHPVQIARDDSGALLVAGFDDSYVEGSAVIDDENPWAARVIAAPALTLDWMRRAQTAGSDWIFGLAAAGPPGELLVGGQVATGSARGPFVSRLDAAGDRLWSRSLGMAGIDAVTAVQRGPDGLVYVAGATFELIGARSYGGQDIFVVVLDPTTGATVRTMQAGSADADYPRDLAVGPDGTVYVVGETIGSLPGGTAAGDFDVALVRFAPDGTWTGSWQRGTATDDTGKAIALTSDGVVLVGYTHAAIIEGAAPLGGRDGFLVEVAFSDLAPP